MTASAISDLDRERLLEAISEAQAFFIGHRDLREIFDLLLMQLLALTSSEYGYIGEVLYDEAGAPYLKNHAISNIAWDDKTRRFYAENAPAGLEFRRMDTLFGHVITQQVAVISNDPANDPRAGGLPPGHPPLDAYLGLPIFVDGELIGSAGISNRPGGYDEAVVDFLQPFLISCASLMSAQRLRSRQEEGLRWAKDLVSVVSHELRTPMTAIRGALGLTVGLHKDALPPEAAELVQLAHESCERMLHLLDDLLDVHRLDVGDLELRSEACELSGLIHSCAEVMRPLAEEAGVVLSLGCTSAIEVVADEARVAQVLSNLIGNAIKFSPPGSAIQIGCRDAGDSVCVDVQDAGPGIPKHILEGIFQKFRKHATAAGREEGGLGLGLYLARSLMEKHGGSLNVRSQPGQGACFTMVFPKPWTRRDVPSQAPGVSP